MLDFKGFGTRDDRIYDPSVFRIASAAGSCQQGLWSIDWKTVEVRVRSDQCDDIIISAKRGQAQLVDFIIRGLLQCPKEVDLKS